jgi:hypothetical protein
VTPPEYGLVIVEDPRRTEPGAFQLQKVGPPGQHAPVPVIVLGQAELRELVAKVARQSDRKVIDCYSTRTRRRQRQLQWCMAVALVFLAGSVPWLWGPVTSVSLFSGADAWPTVPTGASFNLALAAFEDERRASLMEASIGAKGLPAFVDSTDGRRHHVFVGPYLTIDEAERAQRRMTAAGLTGGRLFVDDSMHRASQLAGSSGVSAPTLHHIAPVLVGAAGRVSVILELASQPRHVRTRRVSATTLVIDAGPLAEGIQPQTWSAPETVELVRRISMEEARIDNRSVARVQLTLPEVAWGRTRVVGRRLYIDLSWPELRQAAPLSEAFRNAASPRTPRAPDEAQPAQLAEPSVRPDARAIEIEGYRGAIRPIIARFEEMEPFLVSATQAPSPEVLAALGHTLATLSDSLRSLQVPGELTSTHGVFVSALKVAGRAVDPALRADRAVEVRQALALFDLGVAQLSGETPEPTVASLLTGGQVRD